MIANDAAPVIELSLHTALTLTQELSAVRVVRPELARATFDQTVEAAVELLESRERSGQAACVRVVLKLAGKLLEGWAGFSGYH